PQKWGATDLLVLVLVGLLSHQFTRGEPMSITVLKRDGTRTAYDGYEVARSIQAAARGLDDAITRTTQLQSELEITLFDGITSEELDQAVIQVALQNVKDDPSYDVIAARLLVKSLYKQVFGETHDLFGDNDPGTVAKL